MPSRTKKEVRQKAQLENTLLVSNSLLTRLGSSTQSLAVKGLDTILKHTYDATFHHLTHLQGLLDKRAVMDPSTRVAVFQALQSISVNMTEASKACAGACQEMREAFEKARVVEHAHSIIDDHGEVCLALEETVKERDALKKQLASMIGSAAAVDVSNAVTPENGKSKVPDPNETMDAADETIVI